MPDATNSEQNPATEEPDAEYTNRAARRRRGKNRSEAAGAGASAHDTGRRYVGQGPRQWTVRHGG
jgi:hypothetical protein